MFQVIKEIHFSYGHRLLNYRGKCAHPHGHNGKIEIELKADVLDGRGMVYDFGDIKRVIQKWIDESLDHKMILQKNDPLVKKLEELGEPFLKMDENPTAESLAKLVFQYGKSKGLPISKVTFWETLTSSASYSE